MLCNSWKVQCGVQYCKILQNIAQYFKMQRISCGLTVRAKQFYRSYKTSRAPARQPETELLWFGNRKIRESFPLSKNFQEHVKQHINSKLANDRSDRLKILSFTLLTFASFSIEHFVMNVLLQWIQVSSANKGRNKIGKIYANILTMAMMITI